MLCIHPGEACLHGKEGSLEIDGLNLVPIGLGHDLDAGRRENAGVADQDVETAETVHGLLGYCLRVRPERDVRAAEGGFPTGLHDRWGDGVAGRFLSRATRSTLAPSAAKTWAMPLPMPRLPPVMTATLPFSSSYLLPLPVPRASDLALNQEERHADLLTGILGFCGGVL